MKRVKTLLVFWDNFIHELKLVAIPFPDKMRIANIFRWWITIFP